MFSHPDKPMNVMMSALKDNPPITLFGSITIDDQTAFVVPDTMQRYKYLGEAQPSRPTLRHRHQDTPHYHHGSDTK